MSKQAKVELNSAGVRELLRSTEMKNICFEHATKIKNRVGTGYEVDTYQGKNRVNAMVSTTSSKAKRDNLQNNSLLKAVRG